jgi:hypothetical protein
MAIKLEAHVDVTHDGGFEFYDRVGAIVVHVDGDVVKTRPDAVKLVKPKGATEHLGPLYTIEIPEALPITVQCWKMTSVQQGRADELLENAEDV